MQTATAAGNRGNGSNGAIKAAITADEEKRRKLAVHTDPFYRNLPGTVRVDVVAGSAVWMPKLNEGKGGYIVRIRVPWQKGEMPISLAFIDIGPMTPELKAKLGIHCT